MAQIKTYTVDPAKRRLLTVQNMEELGITPELIQQFIDKKSPVLRRVQVDEKRIPVLDATKKQISLWPIGVSINDKKFGIFPDPNAAKRGWMASFEIGAPLFEERSNIIQPTADILSTKTYENRSSVTRNFSETIQFTIGSTISWSLSGSGSLTFGGKVAGELQGQISQTIGAALETSLSNSLGTNMSNTLTTNNHMHNHRDNVGTEVENAIENQAGISTDTTMSGTGSYSGSYTGTGTAIGHGELYAEMGLSLTGTISGTLSISVSSSSTISGSITSNSRVETSATQRRQIKQFTYEVPITFDGYVALNYGELVLPFGDGNSPVPSSVTPAKEIPVHISYLEFIESGKLYRPKGIAEKVSTLDVNHTIFDDKPLFRDGTQKFGTLRPHNL